MKPLYSLTIALSAVLLFSVEPMVTRALLPQLGGSSAVWISALAFFQVTLMLGYAYTTAVAGASSQRPAAWLAHLGLLLLATLAAFLPITQGVSLAGHLASPQLRLFVLLGTTAGLPFFTLSTTAPLLQAWYARREQAAVPYRLFALSNGASLAALLAYPTLLEPALNLNTQFLLWRAGFIVYAVLAACLTLRMRSGLAGAHRGAHPPRTPGKRGNAGQGTPPLVCAARGCLHAAGRHHRTPHAGHRVHAPALGRSPGGVSAQLCARL